MLKTFINVIGFIVITFGLVTALYHVEAITPHTTNISQDQSEMQPQKPQQRDPNRLWCREHGVYEDECVICHPELANKNKSASGVESKSLQSNQDGNIHEEEITIEPGKRDPNRLWCREHGVYEDECVICHPELANKNKSASGVESKSLQSNQDGNIHEEEITIEPGKRDPNRLWCREHGVYEDECLICHPELAGKSNASSEVLFCSTHQVPERQCGICQPQLTKDLKTGQSLKIRLLSLDAQQKGGIRVGTPLIGDINEEHSFLCDVQFNQNRFAHISPLASGVVQNVFVDLGDQVEKGQVLLEVASNQIANAKSKYLKALDQLNLKKLIYNREKELNEKNISAKQDFQQAEAEYQLAKTEAMTAHQQLLNYGLTPDDIEKVKANRSSTSVLKVRAPFSGVLVEKHAVMGEAVDVGESIFQLVDLSTMWLDLSIPESRLSEIKKGKSIVARFEALPEHAVEGRITWIAPNIDPHTRMLKARAEIPNPDSKLKHGLFGKVQLLQPVNQERMLVPSDSVQTVDGKPFVFVQQEADLFDVKNVSLGTKANGMIEVREGLSSTDQIVIAGSFVLKSELLKSRFGAGCAND